MQMNVFPFQYEAIKNQLASEQMSQVVDNQNYDTIPQGPSQEDIASYIYDRINEANAVNTTISIQIQMQSLALYSLVRF